jgi:hypothetical protein
MSEYARAEQGTTAASAVDHAPRQYAAGTDVSFAAPAQVPVDQNVLAASLNRSARAQSLAQTKQMLHDSPRMQVQRVLQLALNPSFGSEPAQRETTPDEEELAQAQFEPVQRQADSALPSEEEEDGILQGRLESMQRQPTPEEDEMLQGKFAPVQRQLTSDEEEETLQRKFDPVQRQPASETESVQQGEPNHTGLPDSLKTGVEALSGFSLSDVRVHYNSPQPAQLSALAYAQGSDIHVAPGQERHLPHEAWHVVQQKQGRVQPTLQAKGVPINDDAALEREADVMGGRASAWSEQGIEAGALASRSPLRPMQFTTDTVLQAIWPFDWLIEKYHDYRRLGALNEVLQEAITTMGLPNVAINAHGTSEVAYPGVVGGNYQVRINPNDPVPGRHTDVVADPDKMMTGILHELTHVAVDQGYGGANVGRPAAAPPQNLQIRNDAVETAALDATGLRLDAIFAGDNLIPALERNFIQGRLDYMRMNSTTEFDTVANDVLYYLHLKGVPARSEFSKALTNVVRERKRLRG